MTMIGYKITQIRVMVPGAGVHAGFAKLSYHCIQVIGHAVVSGAGRSASQSHTVIGSIRSALAAPLANDIFRSWVHHGQPVEYLLRC